MWQIVQINKLGVYYYVELRKVDSINCNLRSVYEEITVVCHFFHKKICGIGHAYHVSNSNGQRDNNFAHIKTCDTDSLCFVAERLYFRGVV